MKKAEKSLQVKLKLAMDQIQQIKLEKKQKNSNV